MKRYWLYSLLVFSLLLNMSVLGAVGYQAWQSGEWPEFRILDKHNHLAEYLNLSEEQRRQWQKKEKIFLHEMGGDWEEALFHRERMIRQIFSERPDLAAIEVDHAAISRIQEKQQHQVIKQLMEEQRILDATQRQALADLLIQQKPTSLLEEHLHGD